jgi:hypothetical protein
MPHNRGAGARMTRKRITGPVFHSLQARAAALAWLAPAAQAATYTWGGGTFVAGVTAPSPLPAGDVLDIGAGAFKIFSGSGSNFTNNGTFRKSTGTGVTTIGNFAGFVNNGALDAQTGTISDVGGTVFNSGTVFTIAGINLAAGNNSFVGSFNSANLVLASGTHSGTSAVLNGSANWTGGTLDGNWTVAAGQQHRAHREEGRHRHQHHRQHAELRQPRHRRCAGGHGRAAQQLQQQRHPEGRRHLQRQRHAGQCRYGGSRCITRYAGTQLLRRLQLCRGRRDHGAGLGGQPQRQLCRVSLSGFATGSFSVVYDTAADRVQLLVTEAVTAVPEPETCTLMLAGLAALGFLAKRHRGAGAAP